MVTFFVFCQFSDMAKNPVTVWVYGHFSVVSRYEKKCYQGIGFQLSVVSGQQEWKPSSVSGQKVIFSTQLSVLRPIKFPCSLVRFATLSFCYVYFSFFYMLNIFYIIYNSIYNLRIQINFLFSANGVLVWSRINDSHAADAGWSSSKE